MHHFMDTNDFSKGWQRGGVISDQATGPGSMTQSSFGPKGNFEVVVPEGRNLVHHFIDASDFSKGWQRRGVISDRTTGPGSVIQSSVGPKGNFEVAVLEGRSLVHHFIDTCDFSKGRQREPSRLSSREREVLSLLVRGMSMKQVGRELGIAARTVAFHKYKVMHTNGLRNNADLLAFSMKNGMLNIP